MCLLQVLPTLAQAADPKLRLSYHDRQYEFGDSKVDAVLVS